MFNIEKVQYNWNAALPLKANHTQTEMHSLPKALHKPCDHSTDKAESRRLEHRFLPTRVHKTRCSNILESHKYSCVIPFDNRQLNRWHAAQGSAKVHRSKTEKEARPKEHAWACSVRSRNGSMGPLNNSRPEDPVAFPTDADPQPTAYELQGPQKERAPGCATHSRVGTLPPPTISRHTGNTGQQKLSLQLPSGKQSLGLESTKMGGKRLTANTWVGINMTDAVTRTARRDRRLDRMALLCRASTRRDLLIALHTAIQ